MVLPSARKVINVHGCFWHMHACQRTRKRPVSNATYWKGKLACNVARDAKSLAALRKAGWKVLTVWECQMRDTEELAERLRRFLSD